MQLIFLGSGSAFTVGDDNFQCNILLVSDHGLKLLLDCGSDIRLSLYKAGFKATDITDVYISHLHSDHVGGLEYLGFSTLFAPQCDRPRLYLSQDLLEPLWERTLRGGMGSLQNRVATLETFFQPHPIASGEGFCWESINFHLIAVPHVQNKIAPMPTYGLWFAIHGTQIFMTTDTQFDLDLLLPYYQQADLIFHDCETGPIATSVHARYGQLASLPPEIKGKMWLCGYQPRSTQNPHQDGFLGFVQRGQTFYFPEPHSHRVPHPEVLSCT
jgi:hypothetical protein